MRCDPNAKRGFDPHPQEEGDNKEADEYAQWLFETGLEGKLPEIPELWQHVSKTGSREGYDEKMAEVFRVSKEELVELQQMVVVRHLSCRFLCCMRKPKPVLVLDAEAKTRPCYHVLPRLRCTCYPTHCTAAGCTLAYSQTRAETSARCRQTVFSR